MDELIDTAIIQFPKEIYQKWQLLVNNLASIFEVPAALIMKVERPFIEVFMSSKTIGNPYNIGDKEKLPGLYCNYVITNQESLHIPDALKIREWENNPDIKLGMISYLGYPLNWPNGDIFGTICVLDNKANEYEIKYQRLLSNFKEIVESHLNLIFKNKILENQKNKLETHLSRIKMLESYLTICSHCKKIKNDKNEWIMLENYIQDKTDSKISHGLCKNCLEENYPEFV